MMRAKDHHMAGSVNRKTRQVLLTGSIDQNDQDIIVRFKMPEGGLWTFIKAEVNLSEDPWVAWMITAGEGCSIPKRAEDRLLMCRQFKKSRYLEDRGAIIFSDGE